MNSTKMKKYQIIYADPPWSYSISSGVAGGRGQNTSYRCLRPVEIYDFPVNKISDDNCCLFLWASFPMLPEALYAMKAWSLRPLIELKTENYEKCLINKLFLFFYYCRILINCSKNKKNQQNKCSKFFY